jgi:magnesium transporter
VPLNIFAFGAPDGPRVVKDPGEISDLIAEPDTVVWVDAVEPTDQDLDCFQREFSLHPLALEDVRKDFQRPKLEIYPTHAFLVAYANGGPDAGLPETDIFVGRNWLVTVRERNLEGAHFDIDAVHERVERTAAGRAGGCSAGFLLYVVLDEIVDTYFGAIELIEDALEDLESQIFSGAPNTNSPIQQKMLEVRRQLLMFRRRVAPLREVIVGVLRGEIEWITDDTRLFYEDVLDHLLRVLDGIDTQRELLGNAVDAHLALVSNEVNDIMKKMTSWGAILLGSTLVAGIYGMNFDNMPELHWQFGYFSALGVMGVLTITLYVFFRRKHWL